MEKPAKDHQGLHSFISSQHTCISMCFSPIHITFTVSEEFLVNKCHFLQYWIFVSCILIYKGSVEISMPFLIIQQV